jgi:hypothetical protein
MSDPVAKPAVGGSTAGMTPSIQKWSTIVQTPELVGYFDGVFGKAGISVEPESQTDAKEEFTVVNGGESFSFHPGIDSDVEFVVPLNQQNVENMLQFAGDGKFDARESWRIVQVLFTPITRAALSSPKVSSNWLRALTGVEPVIHVNLVDPDGGVAVCHTLAFAGDQWLVIDGLHGNAKRTFWLSPEQALTFQRKLYSAMKDDNMNSWWQFANWYREWRTTVSSPG